MEVGNNKVVAVKYILEVDHDGNKVIADKSEEGKPLMYIHGLGSLLPDFESALSGLRPGDKFEFSITAERGYGVRDENEVVKIPVTAFQDEKGEIDDEMLKPGNVLPMQDQDGNRFQGYIVDVQDGVVSMDFNHPLAGKELHFSGSVEDVREATNEELSHGHVHGPGGHHH